MNGEELIRRFKTIYGPEKGTRIYMNVMPGVLGDFNRMLVSAKPGEKVSEEYIMEDKKAVLILTGRKAGGKPEISFEFNKLH